MSRDLKFRAMNYVSHTWWYGSNQVDRIDYGTNTMPIRTFWRWFAENALDIETLSQYICPMGKVGAYEGDIVKMWNPIYEEDCTVVIEWDKYSYKLRFTPSVNSPLIDIDRLSTFWDGEVIGNIYSNPELVS